MFFFTTWQTDFVFKKQLRDMERWRMEHPRLKFFLDPPVRSDRTLPLRFLSNGVCLAATFFVFRNLYTTGFGGAHNFAKTYYENREYSELLMPEPSAQWHPPQSLRSSASSIETLNIALSELLLFIMTGNFLTDELFRKQNIIAIED